MTSPENLSYQMAMDTGDDAVIIAEEVKLLQNKIEDCRNLLRDYELFLVEESIGEGSQSSILPELPIMLDIREEIQDLQDQIYRLQQQA
ncbi:hypothetical protein KA025_01200 [Candidatus Saccharibacteria bacterium]|jgi:hypothetical protein|nr:hypothetical protein [Candidatus Saccharibacteria bacterium]MBP7834684.1 hypothetical protein [Candidatus Saccharibacteria bacterium]